MKSADRRKNANPWPSTETPSHEMPQYDPVDEAAEESFPASDPPAFTGSTATPSQNKRRRPISAQQQQNQQ